MNCTSAGYGLRLAFLIDTPLVCIFKNLNLISELKHTVKLLCKTLGYLNFSYPNKPSAFHVRLNRMPGTQHVAEFG